MLSELQDLAIKNPPAKKPSAYCCAIGSSCPACEAARISSSAYFGKVFGPDASIPAIAELIADDLGFCSRHGQALAGEEGHARQVARACAGAIEKIQPLLQQSVIDERCQRLFFSAGNRCPACAAEDAAAAKHVAVLRKRWLETLSPSVDVDALCWPHFQIFAGRLPIEPRGRAVQQRLDALLAASQSLEQEPREELPHALALLGHAGPIGEEPWHVDASAASTSMKSMLDDPHACPICELVGGAGQRWLEGLRWAAENEAAGCLWLFAPCCKRHVSEAVRLGRPELLVRIASFVLWGMAEQSRQQLANIVRDLALAEQPKPVWYRPRRRRREASVPAPTPGKRFVLRCRGCEAEAIALERASGTFLELMRHARYRDQLANGHGLCLQHLAHVLPVASPEVIRPFLSQLHADRLNALNQALSNSDESEHAWREAVRRFKGWPTQCQDH